MLTITAQSHLDHGLTAGHINLILSRFGARDGFFIETIELPEDLPMLACSLWGPIVGDPSVHQDDVRLVPRPGRELPSRVFTHAYARPSRLLTVIAGPYSESPSEPSLSCMLYTAFGGPAAPRELSDPTLTPEQRVESEAFWSVHGLSFTTEMVRSARTPDR